MKMRLGFDLATLEKPHLFLSEVPAAVQSLRDHRAAHSIGIACGCGEKDDDGLPYLTLDQEAGVILSALRWAGDEVLEILNHTCKHPTDETDSYYLKCGICGSDGNA